MLRRGPSSSGTSVGSEKARSKRSSVAGGDRFTGTMSLVATLSWGSVFAVGFFNVSGGPWGSEEIFKVGGPVMGTAQLLFVAIFLAHPLIEVTAELSSCFPYNGGYSIWVTEAFGSFWGLQESFWSWTSGVMDNALYPVLIFDGINAFFLPKHDDESESIWNGVFLP